MGADVPICSRSLRCHGRALSVALHQPLLKRGAEACDWVGSGFGQRCWVVLYQRFMSLSSLENSGLFAACLSKADDVAASELVDARFLLDS